jgi:hypothetical protein
MAKQTDLLMQAPDGSQYVLLSITNAEAFLIGDTDDLAEEVEAARKNKSLMQFLDERGTKAKQGVGIPISEVRRQLGL